jgi:uncharacterized membrane protein
MSVNIGSDNSTDELRIDSISKAARQTGYKTDGTVATAYAVRDYYRASISTNLVAAASTSPFFASFTVPLMVMLFWATTALKQNRKMNPKKYFICRKIKVAKLCKPLQPPTLQD